MLGTYVNGALKETEPILNHHGTRCRVIHKGTNTEKLHLLYPIGCSLRSKLYSKRRGNRELM